MALHAFRPLDTTIHRAVEAGACSQAAGPVHGHDHDCRVIEIWIVRIGILARPSAGPNVRAPDSPISCNIDHLPRHQPVQSADGGLASLIVASFKECMTGETRVPYRRYARLAV